MRTGVADRSTPSPRKRGLLAAAVVAALVVIGLVPAVEAARQRPRHVQIEDVLGQGGNGVHQRNGAKLIRWDHSLDVEWRVPTPTPGGYTYPTPDQVPPGAPTHPPIEPGHPEVFTLWAFIFNYPELCSDACDMDDIGDTPAQGGVYQLDGRVAYKRQLHMSAHLRLGQPPLNGVPLQEPRSAEVHVAMAPHGKALSGDQLAHQLNSGVGGPPVWFPAIFIR